MTSEDLRRNFRHKGRLRVSFERGTGFTRDFSPTGVYFVTPVRLAVGESIVLNLKVDHESSVHHKPVKCKGTIVRIEAREQLFGVAFKLEA
jgi:PilZ domain